MMFFCIDFWAILAPFWDPSWGHVGDFFDPGGGRCEMLPSSLLGPMGYPSFGLQGPMGYPSFGFQGTMGYPIFGLQIRWGTPFLVDFWNQFGTNLAPFWATLVQELLLDGLVGIRSA